MSLLLRIGAALFATLAVFFLFFVAMLVVAVVFFIIAAALLAIYFLVTKKPEVEHDGSWTLDKVQEKKD